MPFSASTVRFVRAATMLILLYLAMPSNGSIVQVELNLDGENISGRTTAQLGFYALDARSSSDAPALTCQFGKLCSVPAGIFSIDVVSDELILIRRPKIQSDPPDVGEQVHPIRLDAIRSAWILPSLPEQNGYRLDLLDPVSGVVFHGLFGPEMKRLKVPARELVGALRDGSRHLGLFRMTPKAGEVVNLRPPASPAKGHGQLLCSFAFPKASETGGYVHLLPALLIGAETRPPDVIVTADLWHVWAVWFSVPTGAFRITTRDPTWVPRSPVNGTIPDRGTLSLGSLKMILKPSLSATLATSDRLGVTAVSMELFDCDALANTGWPPRLHSCTSLGTSTGATGTPVLFQHLTPSLFALQWHASHFSGIRMVDMRDGTSRSESFVPEILHITGTVRRAGVPASATVRFVDGATDTTYETKSNDYGEYEVSVCPRSAYIVSTQMEGLVDFRETLDILADGMHDINLPAQNIVVKVVDAKNGAPIPRATVTYTFRGEKGGRGGIVNTDGEGSGVLPPLGPGSLTYRAAAKAYRSSADEAAEVTEPMQLERVVVLTRAPASAFQVLEANGTPAVNAIASCCDGRVTAPSGEDGQISMDEAVGEGGAIAVANSAGALSVFRWNADGDHVFTMHASGLPIKIRFETARGKPVRYQLPRYSIDGIIVPHPLDMQARLRAGGDANSKWDGTMVLPGLPSKGTFAIWPALHPELSVSRSLPVNEEIRLQSISGTP